MTQQYYRINSIDDDFSPRPQFASLSQLLLIEYVPTRCKKTYFTVQQLNDINVQQLNIFMDDNQDHFNVLRKINSKSNSTQRELAAELGFSLGKLNYCLKALNEKGLIKIKNFQKNNNKLSYFYVLTPKGIKYRIKLTIQFMNKKMKEFDDLKKEI